MVTAEAGIVDQRRVQLAGGAGRAGKVVSKCVSRGNFDGRYHPTKNIATISRDSTMRMFVPRELLRAAPAYGR
jgi:hypothetical protein